MVEIEIEIENKMTAAMTTSCGHGRDYCQHQMRGAGEGRGLSLSLILTCCHQFEGQPRWCRAVNETGRRSSSASQHSRPWIRCRTVCRARRHSCRPAMLGEGSVRARRRCRDSHSDIEHVAD
jgi:hypothetical protein